MSRLIINKKKRKVNLKFNKLIFFSILFFIFFIFYNIFILENKNIVNYIEAISKKYNYIFTKIDIDGLNNISEYEIQKHFENYYNKSIFLIPISSIYKDLEKNNWIESLIIKNNFKNKISIFIQEQQPIAIYFDGKNYLLINRYGFEIDFVKNSKKNKLIVLEGKNSYKQGINLIKSIPVQLKQKIYKARYINNRRWDIYLNNNLIIKLPENGYKEAMNIFSNIYIDLYSSDISNIEYIDLRISKKAVIKFYDESI